MRSSLGVALIISLSPVACGSSDSAAAPGASAAGATATGGTHKGGSATGGSATGGSAAGGTTGGTTTGGSATGGTIGGTGPLKEPPMAVEDPAANAQVHISHIGYELRAPKHAVVQASATISRFQLVSASDSKVYLSGTLRERTGFTSWSGGPRYYTADFSALTRPGDYLLRVNGANTPAFTVAQSVHFTKTATAVLGYFKNSRADDKAVWDADAAVPFYGAATKHNVQGGWYDASGDSSKYLSHLSYANYLNPQQIPLTAWALASVADDAPTLVAGLGLDAALKDEARWGADYLLRVLDDAGYFYIGVFDGWSGNVGNREICTFSGQSGVKTTAYQAAYREGGGLAIAALARVARWGTAGAFTAQQYKDGAEKAFAHLETNGANYCDDQVENVIDDYAALLAASELFATTAKAAYLPAARKRATQLEARVTPRGYFNSNAAGRPFWHASDAGLPVVALARYLEVETDAAARTAAKAAIRKHLDYLVAVTSAVTNPFGYARQTFNTGAGGAQTDGFFIPHDNESGYWWQGENARLASLAAAALIGGRALASATTEPLGVSPSLAGYAEDQLDWVLGKNPKDLCFLKGFGRNNPPPYKGGAAEAQPLDGGISNGITGAETKINGTGLQWLTSSTEPTNAWQNWRWSEQWLPHSSWYLIAIAALGK